ncbi:MAG: lipid-A-disaccharide synthase [Deltaproteobacteria bacterium]|nr:lipid-A-disaccharide synthase [Deltaproteobacteria bacterium]
MSRVMIVAGEASGDLHGANLVTATKTMAPDVEFYGMGGTRLAAAGVELFFDLEHMALMGITEVISSLNRVWSTLKTLRNSLEQEKPAALVLIDYPDFNLRLAKAARAVGVPVFYYICPQIWAWRTGRIRLMEQWVDRRVVVFPFEVEFYNRHGLTADFVGHPLLDIMAPPRPKTEVKEELGFDPDQEMLLLMPGSRKHLVAQLLPIMLQAAAMIRSKRPSLTLALARAETMPDSFLAPFLSQAPDDLKIISGRPHDLQNAADVALVASGTATLETALMLTPMVVVYRMNYLSYLLGRLLVRTDHVAMANLIAAERVVPELIQGEVYPGRIASELLKILESPEIRAGMVLKLNRIRDRLGKPGASRRAAELLLLTINRGAGKLMTGPVETGVI